MPLFTAGGLCSSTQAHNSKKQPDYVYYFRHVVWNCGQLRGKGKQERHCWLLRKLRMVGVLLKRQSDCRNQH